MPLQSDNANAAYIQALKASIIASSKAKETRRDILLTLLLKASELRIEAREVLTERIREALADLPNIEWFHQFLNKLPEKVKEWRELDPIVYAQRCRAARAEQERKALARTNEPTTAAHASPAQQAQSGSAKSAASAAINKAAMRDQWLARNQQRQQRAAQKQELAIDAQTAVTNGDIEAFRTLIPNASALNQLQGPMKPSQYLETWIIVSQSRRDRAMLEYLRSLKFRFQLEQNKARVNGHAPALKALANKVDWDASAASAAPASMFAPAQSDVRGSRALHSQVEAVKRMG